MVDERELSAIVKRVAGRAFAERGRHEHTRGELCSSSADRALGVHVSIDPGVSPGAKPTQDPRGAEKLVTAEMLARVPDGGRWVVPSGARVTALAEEEAWRRGIALVTSSSAPQDARRGDGKLRVVVGADHGGFAMKREVLAWLREAGHVVLDVGTHDENAVDYPDFARAVAEAVVDRRADVGVCVDGAGIGSAMVANKVPGIRAANCFDVASAKNAREHNHANVLTLGGKSLQLRVARETLEAFLATKWGGERHARRVEKITAVERSYSRSPRAREHGNA